MQIYKVTHIFFLFTHGSILRSLQCLWKQTLYWLLNKDTKKRIQMIKGYKEIFKGDLLCKNHFYKVFEHSCVASVCENNKPVMVKIHQLVFL